MVTVLNTCVVLNLPLEMWINVFHNADGNGNAGQIRYLQAVLSWYKDCTQQLEVYSEHSWSFFFSFFANFSLFLWVVSQGSRRSPGQRVLYHWDEHSITSVSSFRVYPLSGLDGMSLKNESVTACLFDSPSKAKWLAWLFYLPGHLRRRRSGRPCWPVNIKKGWWRYAGISWKQPARRSCPSRWAWVRDGSQAWN